MATYLQGVTDYIPQFQPFQPDLNFYNNVLQTKQTQYDSNYKQLNQVYGQYLYANLTHEDNIQRKEELLKNIDVTLKKVSGLDLSLEKNVTQATQVFKPFYEDQYLMKDMAFTKNYTAQRNRAEGLKNSLDEKTRALYWADGVAALDYQREEFKESAIADTLGISNAKYTNYVNVQEKALKITKEAGLSMETVKWSPDGRYMVTTKNGEQLMEPLSKLLESQLGNDPAIQEVYKTQAYVDRKNFAASNAAQFGGDKNAAEMNYLETNFNRLKQQQTMRYESLRDDSVSYDGRIRDIQKQINSGDKNPDLPKALANLEYGKQINDDVLNRVKVDVDAMQDRQGTATTSTGSENPYGDIKSLRWKVDNALASSLMEKDLDESAQIFAFRDAKQSIVADPFAVSAQNHSYRMQEVASSNASREKVAAAQIRAADKRAKDKWDLSTGAAHYDSQEFIEDANGNKIPNPTFNQVVKNESYDNIFTEFEDKGIASGEISMAQLSRNISSRQTNTYGVSYMQEALALLDKAVKEGVMTEAQADKTLHTEKDKNMTRAKFKAGLSGNADAFLKGTVGANSLFWISKKIDYWIDNNKSVSLITKQSHPGYTKASSDFKDYTGYLEADKKWRIDGANQVEQNLTNQGLKNAQFLYRPDGTLRSEDEFMKVLSKESREAINNKANKAAVDYLTRFSFDKTWTGIKEISKIALATTTVNTAPADLAKALAHLPVAQREAYERKIEEAKKEAGGYEALLSAAGKAWKSSTIKTPTAIPGLSQSGLGDMTASGLFTPGRQSINVAPLAFGTKGNAYFHEFERDFRKLDFATSGISFNGTNLSDDKDIRYQQTQSGKKMLNDIILSMNDTKIKYKNFKMSSQVIAGGNADKGAMIIYPDAEWLANYIKSKDGAGLLNAETDYNDILINGISVVSDSKNWSNGLFVSSYLDPIAAIVESNPDGYQWKSMDQKTSFNVTKNTTGTGDYNLETNYSLLDHETNTYNDYTIYDNMTTQGNNLSKAKLHSIEVANKVTQHNSGR